MIPVQTSIDYIQNHWNRKAYYENKRQNIHTKNNLTSKLAGFWTYLISNRLAIFNFAVSTFLNGLLQR